MTFEILAELDFNGVASNGGIEVWNKQTTRMVEKQDQLRQEI